jgi:restriction system protein
VGTIRISESDLLDIVSEEVACSCGVLLTDRNIAAIASRYEIDEVNGLSRAQDRVVRVRSEELEEAVVNLRKAIGNLPDAKPGIFIAMDKLVEMSERGVNVKRIGEAYLAISQSGKYASVSEEATEEIISISGAQKLDVCEFLVAVAEMQNRNVNFLYPHMTRKSWDGAVALDNLFHGEHIPNDPAVYLDQRFVDYLAQNGEDIEKMHWRNFERLATEFFRRRGYEVELGPGTRDGGRDVRVWTGRDSRSGPPLLLIQCKRHKTGNVVGVETIKALWADVSFEGAEKGLIATTSGVSRDGRKLCEIRKWPMSFAQAADVQRWARSMWRHAPTVGE